MKYYTESGNIVFFCALYSKQEIAHIGMATFQDDSLAGDEFRSPKPFNVAKGQDAVEKMGRLSRSKFCILKFAEARNC